MSWFVVQSIMCNFIYHNSLFITYNKMVMGDIFLPSRIAITELLFWTWTILFPPMFYFFIVIDIFPNKWQILWLDSPKVVLFSTIWNKEFFFSARHILWISKRAPIHEFPNYSFQLEAARWLHHQVPPSVGMVYRRKISSTTVTPFHKNGTFSCCFQFSCFCPICLQRT